MVNWHLCGPELVCSFTYIFITEINKSVYTEQKFHGVTQWCHGWFFACSSICPNLFQWNSISGVFPSQTQSIWLGCGGRHPSVKVDNSKAPVFGTMTRSLEELQGRLLVGTPLHLYKTLSGEQIQTQTAWICQFPGKATVRFDSMARKAVKRQSNILSQRCVGHVD